MKSKKIGICFLLSIVITLLLGYLSLMKISLSINSKIMIMGGSLILVLFAWNFIIASRFKFIDRNCKPIDKLYLNHRIIGISIFIIAFFHRQLGVLRNPLYRGSDASKFGFIAFLIVILFIAFSAIVNLLIVKKKVGNYEHWKKLHSFMWIPFLFILYHFFLISKYLTMSFFKVWMILVIMVGLCSAIYSILLYNIIAFRDKLKVEKVNHLSNLACEITLDKKVPGTFKPGQFGYFKFGSDKFKTEVHPFTITSGKGENISFAPKAIGDFTKNLNEKIDIGDVISFDGPFGDFDYTIGSKKQLWIAGGIGVTPFVSFVRSKIKSDYNIEFYYSFANKENAYFDDIFSNIKDNNFKYYSNNSSEKGHLQFEKIFQKYKNEESFSIYYCGPLSMRRYLINTLSKLNITNYDIHFDKFEY